MKAHRSPAGPHADALLQHAIAGEHLKAAELRLSAAVAAGLADIDKTVARGFADLSRLLNELCETVAEANEGENE